MFSLLGLVTRFREATTSIVLNDTMQFSVLHRRHPTADPRAGTVGEARKTLTDVILTLRHDPFDRSRRDLVHRLHEMGNSLSAHINRHDPEKGWCTCELKVSSHDWEAIVGSLSQVSRLFGAEHGVGFEVSVGADGWTYECLEFLDDRLEVLRRHGRIAAFQRAHIMRHESRPGITFG